jgi:hypothetical protein
MSNDIVHEIRQALESWFVMMLMGEAKSFLGIDPPSKDTAACWSKSLS